jgi:hypothetical protein
VAVYSTYIVHIAAIGVKRDLRRGAVARQVVGCASGTPIIVKET